ncbi:MAG: alpha/beta hydrolase [Clostridiales bacterium]|nr:alpha/beta hydrolase [Clostridiales bacterium]
MLLLHGYASRKESFYYQIKYLSERFCVTAPDFPCFGGSEQTERAWSVGDYAVWLEKFIKNMRLDSPHIIAHSFGARVAFKLLSERGELAEKLIICGGAGIVKPRSLQYIRRVNAYRRVKKLFPKFAEKHFGSEEYRRLSPMMKESYRLIVNEDLKDCAKKIKNPTLLLYGEGDTVTPPSEEGEIFHGLIAGSQFEILSGGHFGFCEYPHLYNQKISEFLER